MVQATLDTNVYVSAFAYGGKPLQLLELAARGEITLSVSEPIIEETVGVLRDKFQWAREAVREVDATIRSIAEVVKPSQAVDVSKNDPSDNRILECALEAKSNFIVSGDRDLLRLGKFGTAPIAKVAECLRQLQGQQR